MLDCAINATCINTCITLSLTLALQLTLHLKICRLRYSWCHTHTIRHAKQIMAQLHKVLLLLLQNLL